MDNAYSLLEVLALTLEDMFMRNGEGIWGCLGIHLHPCLRRTFDPALWLLDEKPQGMQL